MSGPARPGRQADAREAPRRLAQELALALERTGESGRALARRLGVPAASLAAIARGRDVTLGLFRQLAADLPGLDAAGVLGRPGAPRPASAREWRFFAALFGFTAERVIVDVQVGPDGEQRVELRVEGVRAKRGSLEDPALRAAVLGAVLDGSPSVMEQLGPEAGTVPGLTRRLEDGDLTHVLRIPARPDRGGIRYRRLDAGAPHPGSVDPLGARTHGRPFRLGTSIRLDYCVRVLELRLRFERPESARPLGVWAWPPSLGVDPDHPLNRWSSLHPGLASRLLPGDDGTARLRIERPSPFACYGLSWSDCDPGGAGAARSPLIARPVGRRGFARTLAEARRRSGLSRRALGRRAELSPATIIELERGREPRLSTVAQLLSALPALSPWPFLVHEPAKGPMSDAEAWRRQRDFFGLESEEEVRDFRVDREGTVRLRSLTRALTWSGRPEEELRLRHGVTPLSGEVERDLSGVSVRRGREVGAARVRLLQGRKDVFAHVLSFEARGRHPTVSYTRRVEAPGMYALTMERALAGWTTPAERWRSARPRPDGTSFVTEATAIELAVPTRRLRLCLRLPASIRLEEPRAWAAPRSVYLVEALEDLRRRGHAPGWRFEVDAKRRLLRLEIERPLVGVRYVISWLMPGASEPRPAAAANRLVGGSLELAASGERL